MIASAIGLRRRVVRIAPALGYALSKMLNPLVGDVIITREEIEGLMRGLLWSSNPSLGTRRLTAWTKEHRESLGRRYASEVGRRMKRQTAYADI